MRVAFDLDGVLADLHGPFVREAARLFPRLDTAALGAADIGASPDSAATAATRTGHVLAGQSVVVTPEQSREVWRSLAARRDFWESLAECEPGLVARLALIAETRGWEVLFITSRPISNGRTVQRQTQRWLQRLGFDLPSVYVVHGSRGQVASALNLDAVVDDRPENCLDVVLESRAAAILLWRGDPGTIPGSAKRLGIASVRTVEACLNALVEAEDAVGTSNLLDGLRRIFGLRTKRPSAFLRDSADGIMTPRRLPPSRKGDDRRRARRVTIVSGLHGHVGADEAPISVREISLGGMAIDTAFEIPIGAVFDFQLEMGDGAVLELRGRALHSRRSGGRGASPRYLTGVEFVDLDEQRSGGVDDLIKRGG